MNKHLYMRLAWTNLKKNKKIYFPYCISNLFAVITFFTLMLLSQNDSLLTIRGGDDLRLVLRFGVVVIGFFSVIFFFYTNGFVIKQRKTELGLYSILGLEKKHISIVLFYEMVLTCLITVVGGILDGTVLGRALFLVLLNLVHFDVTIHLEYSMIAYYVTFLFFAALYVGVFIKNVFQVQLSNPIHLIKGSNQGEKELKASWVLAIIGIIALGTGYYVALAKKEESDVILYFFFAVILVIIGTHFIFACASIYMLKILKKRKTFYYRSKNFITVSGMIYRMKQNAAGLANICILSTMVIVCMTCVFSLYFGQTNVANQMYPRGVEIIVENNETNLELVNDLIEECNTNDVQIQKLNHFRAIRIDAIRKNENVVQATDDKIINQGDRFVDYYQTIYVIPVSDYNEFTNEDETLENDQVLVYYTGGDYTSNTIVFGNEKLRVKKEIKSFNSIQKVDFVTHRALYLIVPNMEMATHLREITCDETQESGITNAEYIYFDVDGELTSKLAFENSLQEKLNANLNEFYYNAKDVMMDQWFVSYGGLLFIGVYFGALFLMVTVLIIYYKQVTEGYDDHDRFQIMQKVGMGKLEVKKTIHKQILIVFAIPILMAVCHMMFAIPIIKSLFKHFGLFNPNITNVCALVTIIVYAMVYIIVYMMTAKVYYKIVKYER